MAGKRQHYIPRCLQRGFLAETSGDAELTWQFRRGSDPKCVGIKDVGVSDWFYSKRSVNGERTLDDIITDYENRGGLGAQLQSLRSASPSEQIDASVAAEIVTHLMVRTRHMRSVLAQSGFMIADEIAKLFNDPERVRKQFGIDNGNPSDFIGEIIDEIIDQQNLEGLGVPRPLAVRVAQFLFREQFGRVFDPNDPILGSLLSQFSDSIDDNVLNAHKNALERGVAPEPRQQTLRGYGWFVEEVQNLILPDCVALGVELAGETLPLFLANDERLELVLMPVASNRLLIGRRGDIPLPSARSINRASATCSDNVFLSGANTPELELLSDKIADRTRNALLNAISSVFDTDDNVEGRQQAEEPMLHPLVSYSVQFQGCADQETANEIGAVLQALTSELSRLMPLDRLDGMTFASDYAAALENLDRGDPDLPVLCTSEHPGGVGVAQTPLVIRDGVRKNHIVFQAWIGLALVDESESVQRDGLHLVISLLSQVAYLRMHENDEELDVGDPLIFLLHPAIDSVPLNYFSARISATVRPTAGDQYANLFYAALADAMDQVPKARLAYRTHGDLDELLDAALGKISPVLNRAADILGHIDGLPEGDFKVGDELLSALENVGLVDWFDLFARDLRALDASETAESYQEKLCGLDVHVERLMWVFQMFPWVTTDGQGRVEIPSGSDLSELAQGCALSEDSPL